MIERILRRAAERFGTPLYVYDLAELRGRVADLRSALPASAGLFYSLKANPHPSVAAELRRAGCRAEVSSPGELAAALEAGYRPRDVLYTGPGKSPAEIEEALARDVRWFSCESAAELRRLGRAVAGSGRTAEVLLRLQPPTGTKAGLSMGDGRQFGFTPEDAAHACAVLPRGIALRGCHVYLGSQFPDVTALLEGFATAKNTIERVSGMAGITPGVVDLGGGFPWPYATAGTGPALTGLRAGLGRLLSDWATGPAPEVHFESGRRLVASAGRLVTTVRDVKERPEGTVVVLDAGINVLGGMSGLGRVLRPTTGFLPLVVDGEALPAGHREPVTADVVGPLCTPLDRLAVRASLPAPREGDLLYVPNVGAYGLSASLVRFLSRPAVVEAVYDGERCVGAWRSVTTSVAVE
ncbi:type III PLP-dependent enzyme [Streptomyces sp. NA02950]|uniref:type III PLP-dependent enzyme n=1 Tax=Streptomyces sp. NA02950 TaxID=2742137 RepID=UPI0015909518|nr:type III PLP-dependent enzyme [Streptomyces sp. NA02950]QKV96358.1 type III PLP-dependent enzyme [Streptomyces sp. NA02950]